MFRCTDRLSARVFAAGAGGGGKAAATPAATSGSADGRWLHGRSGDLLADPPPVEAGGVLAAVLGSPGWTDDGLARIAARRGHAAAAAEGYARHGLALPVRMTGGFALAVLDARSATALFAIDRFGIYPLYHARLRDGSTLVSTDAAWLRDEAGAARELSSQAVFDYVYFHMIPAPGTAYRSVARLGPAQRLVLERTGIRVDPYWEPEFHEDDRRSLPEHARELQAGLEASVADRLPPDTRAAAFLSGGLDSSTVAGWLGRITGQGARAYTVGFDDPAYDESGYATIAARHFDLEHWIGRMQPRDVLDAMPEIVSGLPEPFGNSSSLPTFFCARKARQDGIELLLAGDGGDEIFGGNERYAKQRVFELYGRVPGPLREGLLEPLLASRRGGGRPGLLGKADSYIRQARIPLPDRFQTYNFLHRHPPEDVFTPEFLDSVDPGAPLAAWRERYRAPAGASTLNRMLYLDWKFTLADNDLRKVVGMCARAGVSVGFPMLDPRLVEISCRVPSRLKLRRGELRYFYRRSMDGFLPREILAKTKHGFGLPFGNWIREGGDLQALAYDAVRRLRSRGFFRERFLDEAIALHRDGHASYYGELVWILMMLELWLQHHVDGRVGTGDAVAAGQ